MKIPLPIALTVILAAPAGMAAELQDSPPHLSPPIDWASAVSYRGDKALTDPRKDEGTRATFPKQNELDKTQMPVLLMGNTEEFRSSPKFRQQGKSYVGYYNLAGATVSVLGSGVAIDMKTAQNVEFKSMSHLSFDIAEGVTDLSFERFGATYILRISCDNGADERCLKPSFLTELSNSLFFVGGTP